MLMETCSGQMFDIRDPKEHLVDIGDIATHLAGINRYTGATGVTYSVAEHSCIAHDAYLGDHGVTNLLNFPDRLPEEVWKTALAILLHDAHEAYTGDAATPLMRSNEELRAAYKRVANPVQLTILRRFGLNATFMENPIVKRYDNGVLLAEAAQLMRSKGAGWVANLEGGVTPVGAKLRCWPIPTARWAFLCRFSRYCPVDFRALSMCECSDKSAVLSFYNGTPRASF